VFLAFDGEARRLLDIDLFSELAIEESRLDVEVVE